MTRIVGGVPVAGAVTGVLAAPREATGGAPAPRTGQAAEGARLLRIGSTGADVAALKDALRAQKYAVDRGSTYTEATHHAVMAFQKVNGLSRDGIAGPQTQRALLDPKRPRIGSGERERVIADLSDQVLMIVHRGRLSKIVNASTGNPNHPDGRGIATPKGRFRVYEQRVGVDPGPLGNLYDSSYFRGGVAVHGAPHVPAYRDSHGCVRVPMHLSRQVQREMPVGTQVVVRA